MKLFIGLRERVGRDCSRTKTTSVSCTCEHVAEADLAGRRAKSTSNVNVAMLLFDELSLERWFKKPLL